MRSLWLHYPDDERARELGDQYRWGRDMLVAPVYTKGARTREVYLPTGKWYDFWTNELLQGDQTLTREVDLTLMPILIRAGAIIPFDPVRQYVEQQVEQPTTIRVYSGTDGEFRWYEDDGNSQQYLTGGFAWTVITWDDAAKEFVIQRDESVGSFEIAERELLIKLLPEGNTRRIVYDGQRTDVQF